MVNPIGNPIQGNSRRLPENVKVHVLKDHWNLGHILDGGGDIIIFGVIHDDHAGGTLSDLGAVEP